MANGTTLSLQLAQSHWDQLLVLVKNKESEGDIAASIAALNNAHFITFSEPEQK